MTNAGCMSMREAEKDLRILEQEIAYEAEAAVEDYDAMGDEQKAAEAAEAAQMFEEAAQQLR